MYKHIPTNRKHLDYASQVIETIEQLEHEVNSLPAKEAEEMQLTIVQLYSSLKYHVKAQLNQDNAALQEKKMTKAYDLREYF